MNSTEVFHMFEKVANASGHSKQQLMHEAMRPYLLYAYDPYRRFYATQVYPGLGWMHFTEDTWELLDNLSTRKLSGYSALGAIGNHTHSLTKESSELFKRILNKDLRIGMGAKTINKVFPSLVPTHDVMLAKLFDIKRVKFPCYGSPKIDGVRAEFRDGKFYSRGGHEYVGLDHLQKQLHDIHEPLDGELTVPGKTFQEGSGLIRSDNPTPGARFSLFEIPESKANFIERLLMLEDMHLYGPNIVNVAHWLLKDEVELYRYYQTCRNAGFEGSVIKPMDYEYKGTRSYNWMKMKDILSEDLKVIDVFEGTGKYEGYLGGVIVKYKDHLPKVGGGFSDQQRFVFWNKPESIIGKTIEVFYMEETDGGSLRHPRFIQIREDK